MCCIVISFSHSQKLWAFKLSSSHSAVSNFSSQESLVQKDALQQNPFVLKQEDMDTEKCSTVYSLFSTIGCFRYVYTLHKVCLVSAGEKNYSNTKRPSTTPSPFSTVRYIVMQIVALKLFIQLLS